MPPPAASGPGSSGPATQVAVDPPEVESTSIGSVDSASNSPLSQILCADQGQDVPGRIDPLIGAEIAGVRIVRLIAQGGMGRVYEGQQERPRRTVAVKVVRPGLAGPANIKRFEHESEILARLQHPGIAQIFSAGVHVVDGAPVPYFVMEYIAEAKTLTQHAKEQRLATPARLDLFRRVCEAVAHGHSKHVIHRDLKPSNILVDAAGNPKVIDFGVAKATDSDVAITVAMDAGHVIGTPQYMAPEQLKGDPKEIDVRCDVYALGVVLYELLTGRLPYDLGQKAWVEKLRVIQEVDPAPICSLDRALRGDIALISAKCLEKDRRRRYSSAAELGDELRRHLAGEAIRTRKPGVVEELRSLSRRHRVAVMAAVGSGVVIGVALAMGTMAALVAAVIGFAALAIRSEEARRRAEATRDAAEIARQAAVKQLDEAVEARRRAEEARRESSRHEYANALYQLQQRIGQGQPRLMREAFDEAVRLWGDPHNLPIELRCIRCHIDGSVTVFEAAGAAINAVAYRPDGRWVATAADDGAIRLWDVGSGAGIAVMTGHAGPVNAIAFSADGNRIVTASSDDSIRIWDPQYAKLLCTAAGFGRGVEAVEFSPDAKRVAAVSHDGTCRVIDARTGKLLNVFAEQGLFVNLCVEGTIWSDPGIEISGEPETLLNDDGSVSDRGTSSTWTVRASRSAISPDRSRIVTGVPGSFVIRDVVTGRRVVAQPCLQDRVMAIAFRPDGSGVAIAFANNTVQVWDGEENSGSTLLQGHSEPVLAIAFSPDGRWVATGSRDASVRLWKRSGGASVAVLHGHTSAVTALVFSPDGKHLVTGSVDGQARLWFVPDGSPDRLTVYRHQTEVTHVAFEPDSGRIAAVDADALRLWSTAGHDALVPKKFARHWSWTPTSCLQSGPARRFAICIDGEVTVYDFVTCMERRWNAVMQEIIAISPDGKLLGLRSRGRTSPTIQAATDGRQVAVLGGSTQGICKAMAFSADGSRVAASFAGDQTHVAVWDTRTWQPIADWPTASCDAGVLALSPIGSLVATAAGRAMVGSAEGGNDGTRAWIWDARTGECRGSLDGHAARICSVAFSPDGRRIVTGSLAGTVRIWDVLTRQHLWSLEGHEKSVTSLAFNSDGTLLVTGSSDGTVRVWGTSNADAHAARRRVEAPRRKLLKKVNKWMKHGPRNARHGLERARENNQITEDECRAGFDMVLCKVHQDRISEPEPLETTPVGRDDGQVADVLRSGIGVAGSVEAPRNLKPSREFAQISLPVEVSADLGYLALAGEAFELGCGASDDDSASVVIRTEESGDSSLFAAAADDSWSVAFDSADLESGAAVSLVEFERGGSRTERVARAVRALVAAIYASCCLVAALALPYAAHPYCYYLKLCLIYAYGHFIAFVYLWLVVRIGGSRRTALGVVFIWYYGALLIVTLVPGARCLLLSVAGSPWFIAISFAQALVVLLFPSRRVSRRAPF